MPLLRILTIAALALPAAPGFAQAPPTVAGVDARRLSLGVDSLAVFLIRAADTTETGRIVDALTIREERGRRLLERVYRSEDRVLGSRLDSLTDDLATLAPVRHRSRGTSGSVLLEFGPGRVTGTMHTPARDSVVVNAPLAGTVFSGSSFDLVLRSAPLADGWTATVPAFLTDRQSVASLTARVAGVETVHGERCWRVEADFAGMPVTFWITQEGRRLRQQVMQAAPDVRFLFAPIR